MAILLNPRVWLALALAGLLTFTHFAAYRSGKAAVRADFDAYKVDQANLTAKAERAQRDEEARRNAERDQLIQEAQDAQKNAQNDAAVAAAAADGLRQRVAALVSEARSNPGTFQRGPGKPSADALDLLSNVLSRADAAAGDLAAYADRLRVAGSACERQYDSLSVNR